MIDVEELRSAPIAVLGGGAVGKTCGADCALAGQEVRICDLDPFFESSLGTVERTGITIGQKLPVRRRNTDSLVMVAQNSRRSPIQLLKQ